MMTLLNNSDNQKPKYRIKELSLKLPVKKYKKIRKELPKECGVTWRTFWYRWAELKIEDDQEIPEEKLNIISQKLPNCKGIEDLKNYRFEGDKKVPKS